MGHTNDSARAGHVWPIPSGEMLKLVSLLTVVRLDQVMDDLEGIRDNLVTLERLASRVSTTSTDVQGPQQGSSSEASLGSENSEPGVHGERSVD